MYYVLTSLHWLSRETALADGDHLAAAVYRLCGLDAWLCLRDHLGDAAAAHEPQRTAAVGSAEAKALRVRLALLIPSPAPAKFSASSNTFDTSRGACRMLQYPSCMIVADYVLSKKSTPA
jgi:hypothetical protein